MTSPTPELMRQQNRAIVLATIQEQGPISRVELANLLGLNPATITRIARHLVDEGLVKEEGEGESKGAGRKRVLLRFNHGARLVIGLYATGRQVTGVIADLANNILTRRTALVSPRLTQPLVASLVEELLAENPSYRQRVTSMCLSASLNEALASLIDDLKRQFHVPVLSAETVTLAAIGEAEAGEMTEQGAFMLFHLGSHSQSCLYLKGESQVGQLGLTPDGQPLAELVSDAGLVATFKMFRGQGIPSALGKSSPVTARLIFEAARHDDPAARLAVDATADHLAFAIAWAASALGLEHVVIAGPWLHAADLLLPQLEERVERLTASPPNIVPAKLGDDASLFGAIRSAVKIADTTF